MAVDERVGTAFGKYNITRLLGKGGMGEVYEAFDTDKKRTVALKILAHNVSHDAAFRMRFQRESHAAAILQEPHVIPIHDWGEIDGCLYIDMRLVQGRTLSELIQKRPLEPSRAVNIIGQVGAALDAAHAERLIHRDIKPQNIIVTPADFAYLVDFGIAEAGGDSRLTTEGSQIGTLNYMAPERFTDKVSTSAVDVYALSCVLYESLTAEVPFAREGLDDLVAAHLGAPPPRPSQVNPRVPVAFDDVIARGMAKDPDDRYGTAGGLVRAAQRALHAGGPSVHRVSRPPPGGPTPTPTAQAAHAHTTFVRPSGGVQPEPTAVVPRRRSRALMTVIAVATLVVLGGVGVVIGMLANDDSGHTPTTTQPTAAMPPLVTGPDRSALHQSCDEGFSLPDATGFGTHAGRGTAETSCLFAKGVLTAYWAEYGDASPLPRAVSAPGTVDCASVPGALCNGSNFLMHCQQEAGDGWITCGGGKNARVYLW